MRFAVQTIIFGPGFETRKALDDALFAAREAGFSGVEISQPLARLPVRSIDELHEVLKHHGLDLTGLCGGSLETRIKFCGNNKALWPQYLYADSFSHDLTSFESYPPIAIHPHKHRPSEDLLRVQDYLSKHLEALYLPDTAHLAVVGADVEEEVFHWKSRLAAIHLKGWRSDVGRSAHQYARGFCSLADADDGVVTSVLQRLCRDRYEGWVIVGIDSAFQDCREVLARSANFLEPYGHPRPQKAVQATLTRRVKATGDDRHSRSRLDFLRAVTRVQEGDLETTFRRISEVTRTMFDLTSCEILVVNNMKQTVDGLSDRNVSADIVRLGEEAVAEQVVCHRTQNEEWWGAVPVTNRFNSNHIRYVMVTHRTLHHLDDWNTPSDADLYWAAMRIGWQCELALERVLARVEARIASLAASTDSTESFLKELETLTSQLIPCDRVKGMIPNATSFLHANVTKVDGQAGSKKLHLVLTPKSELGEIVLVCERNRQGVAAIREFTEDDIAILDAISSTVVRTIHSHQTKRLRDDAHQRILHMLSDPLRRMQSEMTALEEGHGIGKLTEFDLPGDVFSWVDTIADQIEIARNSKVLSTPPALFYPTYWLRHIIAPAIRHVQPLAVELGLPLRDNNDQPTIWYTAETQRLADAYVDRILMQRVIFNMLDNAIKHFGGDICNFRVQIHGEIDEKRETIRLYFRDWGLGIPSSLGETIFQHGFRGHSARERRISGDGFGLGMVRRVVRQHNGLIWLNRPHSPTEFIIELPKAIRYGPPESRERIREN